MQEFRIRPDDISALRRKLLSRAVPFILLPIAVGISISSLSEKNKGSFLDVLPLMIPFFLIVAGYGLFRGIKRQKALLESYCLTLTGNSIRREQLYTPTVSFHHHEVTDIIKFSNGSFMVKSNQQGLFIPAHVERRETLEAALQEIKPISPPPSGLGPKLRNLLPF